MKMLRKDGLSYKFYIDGQLVLQDFNDFTSDGFEPFTEETLNKCFAIKCEMWGLDENGDEIPVQN